MCVCETTFTNKSGTVSFCGASTVRQHFRGLSFETISSVGANSAIIHYRPDPADCATITAYAQDHAESIARVTKTDNRALVSLACGLGARNEMYLCDSGGQYLDGTTDVTRTMHFGMPTARERECFTRVLQVFRIWMVRLTDVFCLSLRTSNQRVPCAQGHIALATTVFPSGITGYQLDVFARRALWSQGLDYMHGTGHGVGAFLNVHEGPHGIGTRVALNEVPLAAGMTVMPSGRAAAAAAAACAG